MTQRIFDVENEKDMADLWSILPDRINSIKFVKNNRYEDFVKEFVIGNDGTIVPQELIAINWHDKTEITRPIQEATEADVGKLCKFWDRKKERESIGILSAFDYDGDFVDNHSWSWSHCRRLTKQEIEELC